MDRFVEVFIFTQNKKAIFDEISLMLLIGCFAFVLGVFSLWLSWKERGNSQLDSSKHAIRIFGAIFALLWATLWNGSEGIRWVNQTNAYSELLNVYNAQSYSIVEGKVHVIHEQQRSGHATSEIIVVGNKQFELNYFSKVFEYHQTISHGGVLKEGSYVRLLYYEKIAFGTKHNLILRIDLLKE